MKKIESHQENNWKITGLLTSLYMGMAYLAGIIIFLVVLRYPEISSPEDRLQLLVDMEGVLFLSNLIMYVLFGPALVLFILCLKTLIGRERSLLVRFSAIIGYIWAGSLTASGMIANAAMEPVIRLSQSSPSRAAQLWQMIESVSQGIGNGNGEILGGLMTLGFSLVMVKDSNVHRGLSIFGLIVGIVGILSILPPLVDFTALFGLTQLVWFILLGVTFMKSRKEPLKV